MKIPIRKSSMEGGCGVIGIACQEKIKGKHLLPGLCHMSNRGNGKGGGVAAAGINPEMFNVSKEILENDYLLAIAYLDKQCRTLVEKEIIDSYFEIDHIHTVSHINDYRSIKSLEIEPPEVIVYFGRVKKKLVDECKAKQPSANGESLQDEIVYQSMVQLNQAFYSATGEKRAFALSHGKNLLVLKLVGYGDDVIKYYQLEDLEAHVWIGHHRYPTKGRVWHPGGAHPFVGQNEALVHNGDFANYYSICEYLAQHKIYPHFLTDTEVSVLLFDLLIRTYQYPLEYVIETLAPTTERDFILLPKEKRKIYKLLQQTHMHGSPDGPWFFLIAKSHHLSYSLIGITDTSMLRPQVFAFQKGDVPIGFSASEKQAIDATLKSLAEVDSRFWTVADHYWSARGGSFTDGGAFIFSVEKGVLSCRDKFGNALFEGCLKEPYTPSKQMVIRRSDKKHIEEWDYEQTIDFLKGLNDKAVNEQNLEPSLEVMTKLLDDHCPLKYMRRSALKAILNKSLVELFESFEGPPSLNSPLLINAEGYESEGENSLARKIVDSAKNGCCKFIVYNCSGQRFIGSGLGPNSYNIQIHVYGSSGDYLASGIDGAEIHVHGSAQDQLAQIMNNGTLIVHGDVGQTFMYGAKGGKAFIRGNTAGRPLINAVGNPRVVINGTCLDYLAESFMAGNALKGGGFAIINGLSHDEDGTIKELETPYPGNNLFSLATGGALYIRDPDHKVVPEQLNGGELVELTQADWELILPYLEENSRIFNISLERLLEHNGKSLGFKDIYRKIKPIPIQALHEEAAWVKMID